ncbi:hypothetical protein Bbelb_339420 [Branchiostoma belcheri]|nr:hypothetical protein Bbelb_339420 [Branchiostoma belcheri]
MASMQEQQREFKTDLQGLKDQNLMLLKQLKEEKEAEDKVMQVEWPSPHVGDKQKSVRWTDNVVKPLKDRNVLRCDTFDPRVAITSCGGQTKNVGRTDNVVKSTDDRNVLQMRHVQPQVMQVSRPHVGARPFKALSKRGLAVEQFVC